MSENENPTRPGSKLGRFKYVWLLVLPLVFFLAIAAYWGVPEWNAAHANENQFEQWAATGVPYDNATLEQFYKERTHPEGASDWIAITQLVYWARETEAFKQLPYLGSEGEAPLALIPGGKPTDWPGEPLVASYLEEMEPVIDLIERASAHPTPARFPIRFRGIATLLPHVQDARSIQRLLSLDCDYAFFNQDNKRALRDLSLMKATAEAYDGRESLVSGLVNVALRGIRMETLRRTLTHCEWSAAELETLRDSLLSKEGISERWQDVMLSERAFSLSAAAMPPAEIASLTGGEGSQVRPRFKLFTGPSEVKTLMEAYQGIIELPEGQDVGIWRKRGEALEEWLLTEPSNSLAAMLAPAGMLCLEAEIRAEEVRRWTLTAVALLQFKQQNEQWPEYLAELESVGLNYEDYSDMEKNVFGYEVEGDKAVLWKCPSVGGEGISKTRPLPDETHKDLSDFVVELN